MVDIDVTYEGQLHCAAIHGPSTTSLSTDAPVDNQGKGASFSPTDLVATGLGTCMATVMGIRARKQDQELEGMRVHVKKHMTREGPRRIAKLEVEVSVPPGVTARFDAATRADLEHAANTCPVRLSLLDAIEVPVRFEWQGA
jgi:putative redox protein